MRSSDLPVLVFTGLYLLIAAPYAQATGNREFVFYIAVMLILIGMVAFVHSRVRLHPLCLWGLSLWGLLHMAGGLVHVSDQVGVLYSLWIVPGRLKYDQLVHAYGFGLATWTVWQGLAASTGVRSPTVGRLFIAACAGIGLGALNEVVEFIAVLTMPDTNVGGYENTGWDLVANTVGALTAAILIRVGGAGSDSARRGGAEGEETHVAH